MEYAVTLVPDDNDTFLVTCPDLPGVVTFGETEAEALAMARGAIEEGLAARLDHFEPIPAPAAPGDAMVRISAQMALKVQLMWALAAAGANRAELARRLGWHRTQVDRLFDPNHATRLDQYEAAFAALGRQVGVEVVPMAAA